MNDKILFVDDEPNLLSALTRQLRNLFQIDTALSGPEGLAVIKQRGPYAVVISDYRMPGMDGAQFLAEVKKISSHTVRVMLTGNTDLDTAMAAVNEGNIFRFLTKPCPASTLAKALEAALEQYHLQIAEKELLEDTLQGTIKVLTDILALVSPMAFSRANRIKGYVQYMANNLKLSEVWQYEMAAMLSLLGCVTLPVETLEKVGTGIELSVTEKEMYESYPKVGSKLLAKIPRLEKIAAMIANQHQPFSRYPNPQHDVVAIGAQLLKVALDFDFLISRGIESDKAIQMLLTKPQIYDPQIVAALKNVFIHYTDMKMRLVYVRDIDTNMILAEDVKTRSGLLLAAKGQEITYPIIARLKNFSKGVGIVEPFQVLV